jgi:FMN phosphatase YigB (HAD superfamily)
LLLIFDLDDTLIDTFGSITPWKMRQCIEVLSEEGLLLPPTAYEELVTLNAQSPSSQQAVWQFAVKYHATQNQIQAALASLTTLLPETFHIPLTPYVKETLQFYAKYPLAIVTGGDPSFQRDKLKKAGLDCSLFSMIGIPEDSNKGPYYLALQKKFSLQPEQMWVCGDRIEMDLRPAFEMGLRTVHMRWGRGAFMKTEKWIDHSIANVGELRGIIQ